MSIYEIPLVIVHLHTYVVSLEVTILDMPALLHQLYTYLIEIFELTLHKNTYYKLCIRKLVPPLKV